MRDYEVRTRYKSNGRFRGWRKIADLPTHALHWLIACDWSRPAPETISRNDATPEEIRQRVEIELTARALEGRL